MVVLQSVEAFNKGLISSMAPENVPVDASPSADNMILSDLGQLKSSTGWVPIINTGITGRIQWTDDFCPVEGYRYSPSVVAPDTTDPALFDLNSQWVTLNNSTLTLRNGYILRVASGSIANGDSGTIVERSTDQGISYSAAQTYANAIGESVTIGGGCIFQLQDGRVFYSVYASGATKNIVTTGYTDDNGSNFSTQTHPNTSANADSDTLIAYYYQLNGGASTGRIIYIGKIAAGTVTTYYSDDRGANWTATTTAPGGTTLPTRAFEGKTGRELDTSFSAVAAGTVWIRGTGSSDTIFKSTNFSVDWASATNINYPYGLYYARFSKGGSPGGARIGQFYVAGDGLARSVLFDGNQASALGIKKPTTDPTAGTTSTGRTGKYRCYYTYYDNISRQESAPSNYVEQELANQNLTITPTASSETSVVNRIRFYIRKVPGASNVHEWGTAYLAGEAANSTAAFTVADSDTTILSRAIPMDEATGGCTVPSYNTFTQHQARLVMSGDSPYNTGTVALTNASATVTGTGTSWHVGMEGKYFRRTGDSQRYLILTVASTTSLTLSSAYQGVTATTAGYAIQADNTELVYTGTLKPWAIKSHLGQVMRQPFGENVVSHLSYSNDKLLVWTEDNCYLVSGVLSSSPSHTKQLLVPGRGSISKRSVVKVGNVVYWLSKRGFESWSHDGGYKCLSEFRVADRFDSHKFGNDYSFIVDDPVYSELHIFTTESSSARACDTRTRYNYAMDAFMGGDFNGWMSAGCTARTTGDLPEVRFMYYDLTKTRPMKLSRTVYCEGADTGTLSGTVSSATSGDPPTLTIASGTLDTTYDSLAGRYLTTVRASDGARQDVRIASNTATIITMASGQTWPTFTPTSSDRWAVGGVKSSWQTPDIVLADQGGVVVHEVQVALEIVS